MHRNLVDARLGLIGVSTSSAMGEAISVYSEMDSFRKASSPTTKQAGK
jgi:hypothetical protein